MRMWLLLRSTGSVRLDCARPLVSSLKAIVGGCLNLFYSWKIVVGVMMFATIPASAFAQVTMSAGELLPGTPLLESVPPVENPCPRFAPGSVVHQPPALFSHDGLLVVRFSYQTRTDMANRSLFCFMTPSGLENPTLHVKPGDQLIITVTNNTPAQSGLMRLNPPHCGPGHAHMTGASLNIHYHGTNTSPTCHSDEVIKTLINSGQTFQYRLTIPADEPPGLYWYHPHVHGLSEQAVLGGASGALVVDGIENLKPAVAHLRHRILMIRDQPTIQGLPEGVGGDPNGIPFQDLTVNHISTNATTDTTTGRTTYTPAILHMEAGERQFWRVSNSTADSILDLQVRFDSIPQPIDIVAIDGVPVNSQDGAQPGSLIQVTHFRLPPASRVEFIVNAPPAHCEVAQLVTQNINTGTDGDDAPNRPLLNIHVRAHGHHEPAEDDRVGHFEAYNPKLTRFAGLVAASVTARRLLFFDEIQPTEFFMAVEGQPKKVFDPNAGPAITATQGTVEEWTVENRTLENHEFHLHQVHFLVEAQSNFEMNGSAPAPGITGQFLDTIEVPHWDGDPSHPYPRVTLRIDFRGPDIGDFVFHCHILGHEDLGMMNIIRVQRQSTTSNAPATNFDRRLSMAIQPDLR
ncbi:MAG: multicopper oxidase domain-containing protein [Nitrospira sp.]|nr:multicopper oxidase domain-containing protein [Nitrospira sp.]